MIYLMQSSAYIEADDETSALEAWNRVQKHAVATVRRASAEDEASPELLDEAPYGAHGDERSVRARLNEDAGIGRFEWEEA
jgi:uncharacterized membrane-anchored protein